MKRDTVKPFVELREHEYDEKNAIFGANTHLTKNSDLHSGDTAGCQAIGGLLL